MKFLSSLGRMLTRNIPLKLLALIVAAACVIVINAVVL